MPDQAEPVLSYASIAPEIRVRWLLGVARAMGAIPLTVGVGTMIAFLFRPMPELMALGIWTIVLGTLMVAVGLVCLIVYFFINRMKDRELRSRVNRQTKWTVLLLLINFPAAFLCAYIAIESREKVLF